MVVPGFFTCNIFKLWISEMAGTEPTDKRIPAVFQSGKRHSRKLPPGHSPLAIRNLGIRSTFQSLPLPIDSGGDPGKPNLLYNLRGKKLWITTVCCAQRKGFPYFFFLLWETCKKTSGLALNASTKLGSQWVTLVGLRTFAPSRPRCPTSSQEKEKGGKPQVQYC